MAASEPMHRSALDKQNAHGIYLTEPVGYQIVGSALEKLFLRFDKQASKAHHMLNKFPSQPISLFPFDKIEFPKSKRTLQSKYAIIPM